MSWWLPSSDGGGVDGRLNLFASTQWLHQARLSKQKSTYSIVVVAGDAMW
jgi:hypothetical protein